MTRFSAALRQGFRHFSDYGKMRFTRNHEWIRRIEDASADGTVRAQMDITDSASGTVRAQVGITDYSQRALGDIVFVDLPKEKTLFGADGTISSPRAHTLILLQIHWPWWRASREPATCMLQSRASSRP